MNSLIKIKRVSKKIIIDELSKIIVDHSINIVDEVQFDAKINLLFEDCSNISEERFIANATNIRNKPLYGRLPANYEFLAEQSNNDALVAKVNKIIGDNIVLRIETHSGGAKLFFKSQEEFEIMRNHKNKDEAKLLISTTLSTTKFDFNF